MATATYETFAKPKYAIRKTANGVWRSHRYRNGQCYHEFTSHAQLWGSPLLSIAIGKDPVTGSMAIADGWLAIGQRARGVLAIGQFVNGYVAIGQFATGRIAAVGQFVVAPLAVGQASIALATVAQMGIAGVGVFQFGVVCFGGVGQYLANLAPLFG